MEGKKKLINHAAVLRSVCLTDTQQHRLSPIYSCDLTDIVGNKSLPPHLSSVAVKLTTVVHRHFRLGQQSNFVAGRATSIKYQAGF